jgi:hypothetical protein
VEEGARDCIHFPLAALDELEQCEADDRGMLMRLSGAIVTIKLPLAEGLVE